MRVTGDILDGSGWLETLIEAGIRSSGKVKSYVLSKSCYEDEVGARSEVSVMKTSLR